MAGERKPRGRAKQARYFAPSATGEYVYTGAHYTQAPGRLTWKQAMARRWAMGLAMAALVVLSGCIPVPGMTNTFYVLLPYAGELVSVCSLVWAVGRMAAGGERLREYVYEETVLRLPVRTVLAAVFSAVTAAGEGLFLALHGAEGGKTGYIAAFLLAQVCVLAISLIWRRMERGVFWEK